MTVEVPFHGNLSISSRPKMLPNPRTTYRLIGISVILLLIGWYILSSRLLDTPFSARSSRTLAESPNDLIAKEFSANSKLKSNGNTAFDIKFTVDPHSNKIVLFWTKFFGGEDYRASLVKKLFEGCPVKQCEATGDHSKLEEASAVIFHALDIDPQNLPSKKKNRYTVFFIGESPANIFGNRVPDTPDYYFDMIHSYMLDSDILGHYLYSVPLEKERRNFAEGKKKLVAWFVSNCQTPSRREDYVKKLQKYIPVDVYGKCGQLTCPRSNADVCEEMLKTDYKFYLSFENSICQDYVTEKFTVALKNYVVPIALGAGNMTIFPKNSFLHVDDFPNPEALAKRLKELDKDDDAYNRFHEWRYDKTQVESHGRYSAQRSNWCQLCEKLHDPQLRVTGYKDAKKHYLDGGKCRDGKW